MHVCGDTAIHPQRTLQANLAMPPCLCNPDSSLLRRSCATDEARWHPDTVASKVNNSQAHRLVYSPYQLYAVLQCPTFVHTLQYLKSVQHTNAPPPTQNNLSVRGEWQSN